MKDIKIRIHNAQHSEAVQNRLFQLGVIWGDGCEIIQHTDKPFIYVRGNDILHGAIITTFETSEEEEVTIDDLYKLTADAEPVIKIDNYVVQFNEDSIQVGCTTIPNETVKAIHDKIFKL